MNKKIKLFSSIHVNSNNDIDLVLSLENKAGFFFFSRNALFLNGITYPKFEVVSEVTQIDCPIPYLHLSHSEGFFYLRKGEIKTNIIKLTDFCDFSTAQPGVYELHYLDTIWPCKLPYYLGMCGETLYIDIVNKFNILGGAPIMESELEASPA